MLTNRGDVNKSREAFGRGEMNKHAGMQAGG